jgi:hypothetical protein
MAALASIRQGGSSYLEVHPSEHAKEVYIMVEILYVVAFAMAVVEALKDKLPTRLLPFAAIGIVIILNLLNCLLFGGDLIEAGRDAFISGGIAVGIFAAGTAVRKATTS